MTKIEDNINIPKESMLQYDQFADFTHKYIQDNIARADQKSTIFFSFVMFTLLFLFDSSKINIPPPFSHSGGDVNLSALIAATLLLLMIISFANAILFSFLTIFPRSTTSSTSPIYWESILKNHDATDYLEQVLKSTFEDLVKLKIANCFELSQICRRKYRNLKISIFSAIYGVILFTALQLYLTLIRLQLI